MALTRTCPRCGEVFYADTESEVSDRLRLHVARCGLGYEPNKCRSCGGSGKKFGIICHSCNGTGIAISSWL